MFLLTRRGLLLVRSIDGGRVVESWKLPLPLMLGKVEVNCMHVSSVVVAMPFHASISRASSIHPSAFFDSFLNVVFVIWPLVRSFVGYVSVLILPHAMQMHFFVATKANLPREIRSQFVPPRVGCKRMSPRPLSIFLYEQTYRHSRKGEG